MGQLNSYCQINLVPNHSFEIHDSCPDYHSQIYKAVGWRSFQITPDYYHKCSTSGLVSIPQNMGGYQQTLSSDDSAYAGAITFIDSDSSHETLGAMLTQPLFVGQQYYVSFYISAGSGIHSLCYCNKFGVKFVTYLASMGSSNPDLVNNIAHVYEDSVISDTLNWKFISGSFIADSSYTGLVIGNFFTSNNINYFCRGAGTKSTYTLLDRICVSSDSAFCSNLVNIRKPTQLFNEISIELKGEKLFLSVSNNHSESYFYIFDSIGKIVMKKKYYPGINEIELSNIPNGIYIIRIQNRTYRFIL